MRQPSHSPSAMEVQFARDLRKTLTPAEVRLWTRLRRAKLMGFSFRRQAPMGQYVVDFVCLKARLVIEVDGEQHAFAVEHDAWRTAWLTSHGYRVLRFWNHDVLEETDGVVETIMSALQDPLPTLPSRGRELT